MLATQSRDDWYRSWSMHGSWRCVVLQIINRQYKFNHDLASFPGPYPSLAVWLSGRGPGPIMWTWASHKPQTTLLARTRVQLFRVERWQRMKAILCRSSRDSWEDREFLPRQTVKTHSNILVVLAHVQFKSFYHLSTCDVTHVRKCTRPSPS